MNNSIATGGPKEIENKKITFTNNNSPYYNKTRYNCFKKCFERIKNNNIKNGLDIACSNGHCVYMANKMGFNFKGGDIEYEDKYNKIFIKNFKEPKLFKLEFNELYNHDDSYDIITSFNITHIFDEISMEYLIKVISNKSKFCYLHINPNIINYIKECLSEHIESIKIFKDNINAGPGANIWYYIFIKFKNKINIQKTYKFTRDFSKHINQQVSIIK